MLYILDTDAITLLRNAHTGVSARVLSHSPNDTAVSIISFEEQNSGWYAILRKVRKPDEIEKAYYVLAATARFYGSIRILEFPAPAVVKYQTLKKQKLNIGGIDLRIAAIALHFGGMVVTRNVRDFGRVPGLMIEDWTQP